MTERGGRRPAAHSGSRRRGVTARAALVGLALIPLNTLFLVKSLWIWGGFTGDESLFANTVAALFLLSVLNLGLTRWMPAQALGRGEILTIYLLLGMGTGPVCSVWDLGGALAGTITYPFWFATDENGWQNLLWPYLPSWLTVRDRGVLEGLYAGNSTGYLWPVLKAWAVPAVWWASFVGAVMWVCLCLNSIVRRRWADDEKLPFPIALLPIEMVSERSGLLRNKLWWGAVAFSAGLGVWNTFAAIFPSLPAVPMGMDYSSYVQNRHPWDLIPYQAVAWDPWAIGLCYLMPLDLAFSLFFFDVLWLAEYVVTGHLGWCTSAWSGFPYGQDQTAGGFIALVVVFLALDRRYFLEVARRALGMGSRLRDDAREAFSYRGAVVGALLGLVYLTWFLLRGGMTGWVVAAFLALYFSLALAICRLRAQLGPPTHSIELAMPNFMLLNLVGSRALGPRTLGMFALLKPYLLEQRNNPAPLQLEALKMAEAGRMERHRIAIALALVAPVAVLSYFWASIHVGYDLGMGTGKTAQWMLSVPRWLSEELADLLRHPGGPGGSKSIAMAFGLVFTSVLMVAKLALHWWPLHPVAFPIALSATIQSMTLVIFGTWLVKALLLHYGGLRAHRTALPLFLGLLVGHATAVTLQRALFMLLEIKL